MLPSVSTRDPTQALGLDFVILLLALALGLVLLALELAPGLVLLALDLVWSLSVDTMLCY